MAKGHLHSENGYPLLHGLRFPISSMGSFICNIPDRNEANALFNDTLNTFYLVT